MPRAGYGMEGGFAPPQVALPQVAPPPVIIEMKGFRGNIQCGRRARSSCGTGCFLLRFVYVRRARRDKITCIDLGYDDRRNSQPSSGDLR